MFNGPGPTETLVAAGTTALAIATVFSIVWDQEKHEKEEKWRAQLAADRVRDVAPHIEIRHEIYTLPKEVKRKDRPLETERIDFKAIRLLLVNNGPGIATGFKARVLSRIISASNFQYYEQDTDFGRIRNRYATDKPVEDRKLNRKYLGPGEETEIDSPEEWILGPNPFDDDVFLVFWEVACKDLDGRDCGKATGGLQRWEGYRAGIDDPEYVDFSEDYHRTNSRWGFISEPPAPLPPMTPVKPPEPQDIEAEG